MEPNQPINPSGSVRSRDEGLLDPGPPLLSKGPGRRGGGPRHRGIRPASARSLTASVGAVLAAAVVGLSSGCSQMDRRATPRSPLETRNGRVGSREEANVQIALGRTAEERGDLETAATAYKQALNRDPRGADALQRLAVVNDKLGRFRESAEYYAKALELAPGEPEIFCDKGYSLYLQGRPTEAAVCLRQAIKLRPDLARAHVNLGLLLARQGKASEALAEFRAGGCELSEAHRNLAFASTLERRWDEARNHYALAMAADPTSKVAERRKADLDRMVARLQPAAPGPPRDGQVMTTSAREGPGGLPPLP